MSECYSELRSKIQQEINTGCEGCLSKQQLADKLQVTLSRVCQVMTPQMNKSLEKVLNDNRCKHLGVDKETEFNDF